MKIKKFWLLVILALLAWGYWKGGMAGFYTVFLIVGFIGLFSHRPGLLRADMDEEQAEISTEPQTGELVPAKRGKPDPTRPD